MNAIDILQREEFLRYRRVRVLTWVALCYGLAELTLAYYIDYLIRRFDDYEGGNSISRFFAVIAFGGVVILLKLHGFLSVAGALAIVLRLRYCEWLGYFMAASYLPAHFPIGALVSLYFLYNLPAYFYNVEELRRAWRASPVKPGLDDGFLNFRSERAKK